MTQADTTKTPKGRSPSYPGIPLKTAVERARAAHERFRQHQAPMKAFTDLWGYKKPTTGPASVTFAALKKFGLLKDEGSGANRLAKLTDLALEIVMKEDPLPAIQQAALNPPIHKEMWAQFKADVPPEEALRYEFVSQRGFTDSGLRDFLREYQETIAFAQLASTDSVSTDEEAPADEPDLDDEPAQQRSRRRRRSGDVMTYAVPVAAGADITIEGRFPLTETEWTQFLAVLSAMKPGLVGDPAALPAQDQPPSPE